MADEHKEQTTVPSHEVSELRIGPIAWFLVGLTVATVVVCLLTAGLFNALKNRDEASKRKQSPLASERQKLPPEPRLQLAPSTEEQLEGKKPIDLKLDHPLAEMKRLRKEEDDRLNSYALVDEKAGVVRIPIDEAKKLLLQKGMPARK